MEKQIRELFFMLWLLLIACFFQGSGFALQTLNPTAAKAAPVGLTLHSDSSANGYIKP